MARSELVDYISSNLRKGYSPQQLRQTLLNSGWPVNQVDEAIREAVSYGQSRPIQPLPQPTQQMPVQARQMGIFEKLKTVLIHPGEFFEGIKTEEGFGPGLRFYLLIVFINIVAYLILLLTGIADTSILTDLGIMPGLNALLIGFMSIMIIVLIPILILFTIIGISFATAILHVFAIIFGAKGDFQKTYKAFVYSIAPNIFSFILFFGNSWILIAAMIPIYVWSFIILVKGLSRLHNISGARAFLIALMPVLIALALIFVFVFGSFMMLSGYYGNLPSTNVQIVDYYCTGTTVTISLRNMGTEPINLGDCIGSSISGTTKTCGLVTISRTDGGTMSAGFSKNSVEPAGNVVFTDTCTSQGTGKTCTYKFSVGSSSTSSMTTVSCSG